MSAHIVFIYKEYVGGFGGGDVEVQDGDTIETVILRCLDEGGATAIEDLFDYVIFLKNGKHAKLVDPVADGDTIHVLKMVQGG